jgi:hypothetical protein
MVKIPEKAPDWKNIVKTEIDRIFSYSEDPIIQSLMEKTDRLYYYWDKVRSQPLPPEYDKKIVWALIRLRRQMNSYPAPLEDLNGK